MICHIFIKKIKKIILFTTMFPFSHYFSSQSFSKIFLTSMKKLFILFICICSFLDLKALNPGDILFTGVNTETANEQFSFICMVDIPPNTVITFTDNTYSGTAIGTGEGTVTWTSPATTLAAGTQVVITTSSTAITTATATAPSGTGTYTATAAFSLNNTADQILAYQGTPASPTFLAGISVSSAWLTAGATSSTTSYLPASIASYSVALTTTNGNVSYTANISGNAAQVLAALTNGTTGWSSSTLTTAQTLPPSNVVLLPIHLSSFTAKNNGSSNQLIFRTESESNNSHFLIERSANGKDFVAIGRVEGHGTTQMVQNYEFLDKTPLQGTNYYRLKQIDFDERFEYSKILSVYFGRKNLDVSISSATNDFIKLNIFSQNEDDANISIVDMNGRIVSVQKVILTEKENQIDLNSSLQNGMYIVKINTNSGEQASKVLNIR